MIQCSARLVPSFLSTAIFTSQVMKRIKLGHSKAVQFKKTFNQLGDHEWTNCVPGGEMDGSSRWMTTGQMHSRI